MPNWHELILFPTFINELENLILPANKAIDKVIDLNLDQQLTGQRLTRLLKT